MTPTQTTDPERSELRIPLGLCNPFQLTQGNDRETVMDSKGGGYLIKDLESSTRFSSRCSKNHGKYQNTQTPKTQAYGWVSKVVMPHLYPNFYLDLKDTANYMFNLFQLTQPNDRTTVIDG